MDKDKLLALIECARVVRRNAHTRAIETDAQAALNGSKAALEMCEYHWENATRGPRIAVRRIDRGPANSSRWQLTLLCGHEVWVSSSRRPTIRGYLCPRCRPAITGM